LSGEGFDFEFAVISLVGFSVFEGYHAGDDKWGTFSGKAVVPTDLTAGTYDVVAADESGNTAKASFTVEPSITLKPALAASGSEIAVYGCGFIDDPAGNGLKMLFGKVDIELGHVCNGEEKGTFTATFILPVHGSRTLHRNSKRRQKSLNLRLHKFQRNRTCGDA